LEGVVEDGAEGPAVLWRISSAQGTLIGETRQPLSGWPPEPARTASATAGAALAVATLLRGDDAGVSDLEARPHVAVQPVKADTRFDVKGLTRAMERALARQGLAVRDDSPSFVVEGKVHIGPGQAGQDRVELDWTVRDASGKELGTVSQGSPVAHDLLQGDLGVLALEIANAGASGIAEVIQKSRPPQ
jgi:hypothetical protein